MRYCLYVFLFFLCVNAVAQTEQELSVRASKAYKSKDYVTAKDDYLKLVSIQPRNTSYNFHYGVCLLKVTSLKQDAIKHLEFVTKSENPPVEAFYYLGQAYQFNYQFNKAVANFKLYKEKGGVSVANSDFDADRQISMCQNGMKLFQKFSDIVVLEKKVYDASEFYRLYDEKSLNGSILISKSDQSKVDKKKNHTPIIFYPNNPNLIFFSSYGDKDKGDKDIYVKVKTADGWSLPTLISGDVNTEYDEDYPFFDEQTNMLYFCSKGHNSMGGYDIFSAKYNPSTKRFSDVKNIDFAISSTGNDMFYIPNEETGTAWFASDRDNKPGKLTIYKVETYRYPASLAFVSGNYETVENARHSQLKIELYNKKTNRKIGTYYTDNDGNYSIPLYFAGDFEYKVTVAGINKVFSLDFNIPKLTNLTKYGQKIIHKQVDGKDFVELLVLSESEMSKDDDLLLTTVRQKSELNVSDEVEISQQNQQAENQEFELLNEKLLASKAILEQEIEFEAKVNQKIHDNVRVINVLQDELKDLVAKQNVENLSGNKLKEAKDKINRINTLEAENKKLKVISDSLFAQNKVVKENYNVLKVFDQKLNALPDSTKNNLTQFKEQHKKEMDILTSVKAQQPKNPFENYDNVYAELKTQQEHKKETETKIETAKTEIKTLEQQLATAKTKEKPVLEEKIKTKTIQIEELKTTAEYTQTKIEKTKNELVPLQENKELITSVYQKKADANLSNADITKELKKLDDKNFKPIKNLIEQQYNQQVKSENETMLTNADIQNEQLKQAYHAYQNSGNNVSTSSQLVVLQNFETELKNEIEQLKAQPETLENKKYLAKLENTLQEVTAKIQTSTVAVNEAKQNAKNDIIEEIYPDYNQKIERINETQYTNDWDKVVALREQEKLLLTKITENKSKLDKQKSDELTADIQQSVEQLENRLEFIISKETSDLKSTTTSFQKAINSLNVNTEETVFNEQVADMRKIISEKLDNAKRLKVSANQDNINVVELENSIQQLSETLDLLEAKQSEFEQLAEAKSNAVVVNNEENTSNIQNVNNNVANNEQQNNLTENIQNQNINEPLTNNNVLVNNEENTPNIQNVNNNIANNEQSNNTTEITQSQNINEPLTNNNVPVNNEENTSNIQNVNNNIANNEQSNNTTEITQNQNINEPLTNNNVLVNNEENTPNIQNVNNNIANNEQSNNTTEITQSQNINEPLTNNNVSVNNEKNTTNIQNVNKSTSINEQLFTKQVTNENVKSSLTKANEIQQSIHDVQTEIEKAQFVSETPVATNENTNNVTFDEVKTKIHSTEIQESNLAEFSNQLENYINNASKIKTNNTVLTEIVNNQVVFLNTQADKKIVENSVAENELVQLPRSQYEQELTALLVEKQKTKQAQSLLDETAPTLSKKEQKNQNEVREILFEKEKYLNTEIRSVQAKIDDQVNENKQFEQLQEEYIELETLLIKLNKANSEQVVLYQLISSQMSDLKKTIQQKEVLRSSYFNAINDTEKRAEIQNLLIQNDKNKTALIEQIKQNTTLLKAEIENPTVHQVVVTQAQQAVVQQKVDEVAFSSRPAEIVSSDQIKLILESEDYPKGLFFRIQVGAFAKPLKENVYKDFSPITMENLNKGLIKYMAGYFTNEAKAVEARGQIRQLGFNDAFIVAYCDGKRIPVFEARQLLASGQCIPMTNEDLLTHINPTNTTLLAQVKETKTTVNVPTEETKIRTTPDDLYYTVQIGVFNRYVDDALLKGLKPINTDELNPKTIRYSVGVFNNLDKAKEQRLEAIQKGFTDAFVTAYFRGKRLTVNEANALLANGTAKLVDLNEQKTTKNGVGAELVTVDYSDTLKAVIKTVQSNRAVLITDEIDNVQTTPKEILQIDVDKIDVVLYWWIIHNFESYELQQNEDHISIFGKCSADEKETLKAHFEQLNFSGVNNVK